MSSNKNTPAISAQQAMFDIWSYIFKFSENYFKFVSWGIILGGLKLLANVSELNTAWIVYDVSITVYILALVATMGYLVVKPVPVSFAPKWITVTGRFIELLISVSILYIVSYPEETFEKAIDIFVNSKK